jgi:hypothetical protein
MCLDLLAQIKISTYVSQGHQKEKQNMITQMMKRQRGCQCENNRVEWNLPQAKYRLVCNDCGRRGSYHEVLEQAGEAFVQEGIDAAAS